MVGIDIVEESTRDWDWFACDKDGNIGHFATAGLRALPATVKADKSAAEQLIQYFVHEAVPCSGYTVHPGVEREAGGWKDDADRNGFLRDFVHMASKGLFSYDTQLRHGLANYFLVAVPDRPVNLNQLPSGIAAIVSRTRATVLFRERDYISEIESQRW